MRSGRSQVRFLPSAPFKKTMITQIYETQSAEEARALVQAGVDHVGVLVGKGDYPREHNIEETNQILTGVSAPAKRTVLSLSTDLNEIAEIVKKTKPDILHLGTHLDLLLPKDVLTLKKKFPHLPIMRSISVTDENSVEWAKKYDGVADYLLLDTYKAGAEVIGATGETHDWELSKKIVDSVRIPVILAGGLGPDNVAEAIAFVKPFGVDSKTKTDKTGGQKKDIQKVKEFVRMAKATA